MSTNVVVVHPPIDYAELAGCIVTSTRCRLGAWTFHNATDGEGDVILRVGPPLYEHIGGNIGLVVHSLSKARGELWGAYGEPPSEALFTKPKSISFDAKTARLVAKYENCGQRLWPEFVDSLTVNSDEVVAPVLSSLAAELAGLPALQGFGLADIWISEDLHAYPDGSLLAQAAYQVPAVSYILHSGEVSTHAEKDRANELLRAMLEHHTQDKRV